MAGHFYLASVTPLATLSVPVVTTLLFAYLALVGKVPWQYVLYGIMTAIILAIALRPNIRRLLKWDRARGRLARPKMKASQQSR